MLFIDEFASVCVCGISPSPPWRHCFALLLPNFAYGIGITVCFFHFSFAFTRTLSFSNCCSLTVWCLSHWLSFAQCYAAYKHSRTHISSHCENVVWHRLPCQKCQFIKELSWVKNTFFAFRLVCSNQQPASKPKEKKSPDHTDKNQQNENPLLKCEQVASANSFQSRSSVSEVYVFRSPSLDTHTSHFLF